MRNRSIALSVIVVTIAGVAAVVLGQSWFAGSEDDGRIQLTDVVGEFDEDPLVPRPGSRPAPGAGGNDDAQVAATATDLERAAEILEREVTIPVDYDLLDGVQVPDVSGVAGVVVGLGFHQPFTGTIQTPDLTSRVDATTGATVEVQQIVEYVLDDANQLVAFVDFRRAQVLGIQPLEGDLRGFLSGSLEPLTGEQAIVSRGRRGGGAERLTCRTDGLQIRCGLGAGTSGCAT